MTAESADRYFTGNRPAGLPGDAAMPGWDALAARVSAFDTSHYPVEQTRTILTREHRRLGADSALLSIIEAIDGDTLYVIAGQQAGLFGGPLYTVYKAMHAVRLAARLTGTTGRRVLPLFWVASDDHDFAEVNHLGLRTADGAPETIEYTPAGYHTDMPVGGIVLDGGIGTAIDRIAALLGPGERASRYTDLLRSCWQPGERWMDAFARQMLGLFTDTGLLLFDPRWNGAKALLAGVMGRELADPAASAALVNETADAFETRRERKLAIRRPEGATNLFLETGGVRRLLRFDGNRFEAGGETFSHGDMAAMLAAEPQRFSPAAALRPVCQDAVFPAAALIAGPGERRYLGQIAPLYGLFGVNAATVWPRASFTIIDPRAQRTAEKEGIPTARLFDDPAHLMSEFAANSLPEALAAELDGLGADVEARFAALSREIAVLDKTLVGALENDKSRMLHAVEAIRARAVKARKASLDVTGRRITAASYTLYPQGGPQERWFGYDALAPFLGPEEFAALMELTSPDEERHRVVVL